MTLQADAVALHPAQAPTPSDQTTQTPRRRRLLAGAAALAAGMLAARTAATAHAADGDLLEVGNTGYVTGPQTATSRSEINRSNLANRDDALRVTNDNGDAVRGRSSDGIGVCGEGASGVWGATNIPSGTGVVGFGDVGDSVGIFGYANSAGVVGTGTTGVSGTAFANGPGVAGRSPSGPGVFGDGFYGVQGTSHSTYGAAVHGRSTGGYGLYGEARGTGPIGVYASAENTDPGGGNAYAVYGEIYPHGATYGYAGFFMGNVHANGKLSKLAGSFKIDHPLDPANKYLAHSFVESPDMMNVYNGNVTTDASGEAIVRLPSYFEALNRDFRYQLTVLGQFAQAIVATKVHDNQFSIRSDKPGVEVSWQVTGIRKDAFAEQNRIVPEEPKSAAERGKYLYPEGHGMPEVARLGYRAETERPKATNVRLPDLPKPTRDVAPTQPQPQPSTTRGPVTLPKR